MNTNVYSMVYGKKAMQVKVEMGFASPDNKKTVKGIVQVMDDGEGKKGKGLFFIWDTAKYQKPCLYEGKTPLFGRMAEYDKDFVLWALKEYKKIREANRQPKDNACCDCPIDCTGAVCTRIAR